MRSRSIALVLGALVGLRTAAAGAQEQGVDPLPVAAPIDATFMTADPPEAADLPGPLPLAAPAAPRAPAPVRPTPNAAPQKTAEKQLITMDFQDVEIGVLVKFIS